MKRKYILKNKKRFAAVIMVFSLVAVFTGLMVNAGAASQEHEVYKTVLVVRGDTLWEIATQYAQNTDPRAFIYKIKKLNQIEGDDIFVGQELLIPR